MTRLVVNPRTAQAWEVSLRPGLLFVGRGSENDIQLNDPSVSDRHCRIALSEGLLQIEDLGSTNGTFVRGAAVRTATVGPGQTLKVGAVELLLQGEPLKATALTQPPAGSTRAVAEDSRTRQGSLAEHKTIYCRNHYRNVARHFCPKCQHQFCDLCVNTRGSAGGGLKFCKVCGGQCEPIAVQAAAAPPRFVQTIGPAFKYPFSGDGLILLFGGFLFFGFLDTGNYAARHAFAYGMRTMMMRAVIFSFILGTGYLMSHLKNIISCTAYGDEKMPDWPEFSQWKEDIVVPMFQFVVLSIVSFVPALGLYLWSDGDWWWLIWPAAFLGVIYFPMAFLGIALFDTLGALNPAFVFGSILRIPREYSLAALVFIGILGLRWVLETGLALVIHLPLAPALLADLMTLCLLMTEARILGMLYRCAKPRLGWSVR